MILDKCQNLIWGHWTLVADGPFIIISSQANAYAITIRESQIQCESEVFSIKHENIKQHGVISSTKFDICYIWCQFLVFN